MILEVLNHQHGWSLLKGNYVNKYNIVFSAWNA